MALFIFFQRFVYFAFWLCWAFVPVHGLSLVVASGAVSLCSPAQQGSRHAGAVVMLHGLSCSVVHGIFLDQGSNLCLLCCTVDSVSLDHQGSTRLLYLMLSCECLDFPGGSDSKASAYNAGDLGLIPELGRSPGEENGNPLQYSCLENPMDGGAWWATVHGVAKSQTRLSNFTCECLVLAMKRRTRISRTFAFLEHIKQLESL